MTSKRKIALIVTFLILLGIGLKIGLSSRKKVEHTPTDDTKASQNARAALTVTTIYPLQEEWARTLVASGTISPWQEAIISSEIGGLRINQIMVDIGSHVKRGQILATLNGESVQAVIRKQAALVAQARASLSEAQLNADRARSVKDSGVLSAQQVNQYQVAYETAKANLDATKAQLDSEKIKGVQTIIRAVDDGIISSRSATLGAVVSGGNELFRLVRQDRLEWRAEVSPQQLPSIRVGQKALLTLPDKTQITGTVRVIAPTLDANTRNALVYVDIPSRSTAHAGLYARGEFNIGSQAALTLPQAAVILRDGKSYCFELTADNHVIQRPITVGRRVGNRVEIIEGLHSKTKTPIVATGGAFLNDGDPIKPTEALIAQPSNAQPSNAITDKVKP
ncbi:MAG: efflux RND transporter periplasmic adaptor subunit [Pseudomonadota bacterium]